jgi:hypothetical protein
VDTCTWKVRRSRLAVRIRVCGGGDRFLERSFQKDHSRKSLRKAKSGDQKHLTGQSFVGLAIGSPINCRSHNWRNNIE